MAASNKQLLSQAFSEVVENLAFMFADEAELDEIDTTPDSAVCAAMGFVGARKGTLRIAVPPEMCMEIAGNILGIDPDDERATEKARDALKELLNITCGHLLTAMAGEEPVFDLTVPEVSDLDGSQWLAMAQDEEAACFLVDEHPVLLELELDGAE